MFPIEDPAMLREWRKDQFLSQRELAILLGTHTNSVANWETGRTRIPSHIHLALEQITGQRERMVRRLRSEQERLAHKRHLKEIEQGLPERRAAARAAKRQAEAS